MWNLHLWGLRQETVSVVLETNYSSAIGLGWSSGPPSSRRWERGWRPRRANWPGAEPGGHWRLNLNWHRKWGNTAVRNMTWVLRNTRKWWNCSIDEHTYHWPSTTQRTSSSRRRRPSLHLGPRKGYLLYRSQNVGALVTTQEKWERFSWGDREGPTAWGKRLWVPQSSCKPQNQGQRWILRETTLACQDPRAANYPHLGPNLGKSTVMGWARPWPWAVKEVVTDNFSISQGG